MRKTAILTLLSLYCTVAIAQSANFTTATTSGCSPLVVTFQDQSTGNPASWFWDFGNGGTSTLQHPSATYFVPGTYTVKLTVTNAQGSNTLTRTNYITVYGKPQVNFIVSDSTACFPHPAQFTDLSVPATNTTNTSWLWDFGDGTQSTDQNPLHVYEQTGNYTVNLKVTNDKGCYSVFTRQAYIIIAGGVVTDFSNTLPSVCKTPVSISFTNTSSGPGNLSWIWDFGDGNTSTAQHPDHSYNTPGNYTVTLITSSSSGCTDTLRKTDLLTIRNNLTSFDIPDSVCIDAQINFLNNSNPSADSITTWYFGDGQTSSEVNPVRSYSAIGTYNIKLVNTYTYCSDSVTKSIRVLPRPVVAFTSDDSVRCEPPLTVNFQDQSINAVSWLWDFGDGQTSSQQNPTHTYNSYGDFDVQLVVTNASGCTDTLKMNDYIRIRRPVITFPTLPIEGCIPFGFAPLANINTLDTVTSWSWNFGEGTVSSAEHPTHIYSTQGVYDLTLTITTSTGCNETASFPGAIKVGRKPVVNFSAAPTNVCAFQPVQFTDLTNEADKWLWVFGDGGSSQLQNPVYQYSDTGIFNVTLYATNHGCRDSFMIPDLVKVKPPIALFGYSTSCNDRLRFQFRDSSVGATSWFWNFGDGQTSTQQNPVHSYSSFTTYNVSLTVTNDTCSNTITKQVKVINESPQFIANITEACKTASIQFNIQNHSSNIAEYDWDFGNGYTPNTTFTSASVVYFNSGYYTVSLVSTDIYGCMDTTIKTNYIRINGPVAGFSATNNRGCIGLTTTFNDLSSTDGISNIVNWRWDFGDGSVQNYGSAPFQHTYTDSGVYNVKLIVTDAKGCQDSIARPGLVTTTDPEPFFTADTLNCPGGNVYFINQSNASNYSSSWSFGDGGSSTMNTPPHAYSDTGYYTVKLVITDQFGCKDSLIRPNYVRINQPIASFTLNDSVSSCTPFEVQFTNTSQYFKFVQWDLGTGNSHLLNPIQFYNTPGSYNIQLVAISPGGCRDTAYGSIMVYDTAGSRISYFPLEGCKPMNVDLSAFSPGPMNQYTWDYGDGVLITGNDTVSSHVYNSFGNFVPKVILTDPAGCIIPVTGLDTIRIKGAIVKFGLDNGFYCDSGFVSFIDSTIYNDSISVYHWDFGDGNTSNVQNPGHYYSSPGLYTVSLNVETESSCVDTFKITHAVKIVESPLISIGGDTVVCVNEFLEHIGEFQRPDTSVVRWSWIFPNGNTSEVQLPVAQQYDQPGNFLVSTVAENSSGCRDTATRNIQVNPLPQVEMPSSLTMQAGFPVTIPATYTSNVMNFAWTPDASLNCSECPQPIAAPKFNTNYTVAFVDSNGCRNTGEIQIIVICKDGNVFVPNTFSPNGDGSNDVFYVRGRGLDRVKSLRIFNRWGEVVFEKQQFPVNDPSYGWDGKFKGNKPIQDVYIYQVEVFCDNSQVIQFEGNIALIQ